MRIEFACLVSPRSLSKTLSRHKRGAPPSGKRRTLLFSLPFLLEYNSKHLPETSKKYEREHSFHNKSPKIGNPLRESDGRAFSKFKSAKKKQLEWGRILVAEGEDDLQRRPGKSHLSPDGFSTSHDPCCEHGGLRVSDRN